MGMRATYQYLSDNNLKELKSYYGIEDKISEEIEDSHEEVELALDIDKRWDVLHFMLTGGRRLEPIKNEPLSEAVTGEFSIDDASEFMAYTEKSKIKNIVFALDWKNSVWKNAKLPICIRIFGMMRKKLMKLKKKL